MLTTCRELSNFPSVILHSCKLLPAHSSVNFQSCSSSPANLAIPAKAHPVWINSADPAQDFGSSWLPKCNVDFFVRRYTYTSDEIIVKIRSIFPEMWAKLWKLSCLAMLN